jgi:hypothetical protein
MKKLFLPLVFVLVTFIGLAQPTYKDVAPIFYSRCTSCHNPNVNGISFLNYAATKIYSVAIQNDLNINRMPPWPPDSTYARYVNEHKLMPAEKTAILNWITQGAQKGDTTLAPNQPIYPRYQLRGTANAVFQIPTYTSAAVTSDDYICVSIPMNLTQDTYLRAFEIIPGNPKIVHHVVVNIDTAGGSTSTYTYTGCYQQSGQFSIGAWAPGSSPTIFPGQGGSPVKMGIRIKAGSKIVMQMHYPAGSANQVDSTKIRLYYYPVGTTGVRNVYVYTPLQYWNFSATAIPAGTVKTYTANEAAYSYSRTVVATFPHAHKVGKSIVNYAYIPGDTIPIVRVNDWKFDFQGFYPLKTMRMVPPGYKLFSKHVYDNTSAHVPSPVNTSFGFNTTNEMLFDGIMVMVSQPGDESFDMQALYAVDSLLQQVRNIPSPLVEQSLQAINELAPFEPSLSAYAYPNPFNNSVKIGYVLNHQAKVSVEIYSIYGTLVKTLYNNMEEPGVHELNWDGKNDGGAQLAAGTYLYMVRSGNRESHGKLTLIPSKN